MVIGEESRARYLVREQLAGRDLPNDAIGETPDVTGSIVFNQDGSVDPQLSSLTVDLRTLRSDQGRRDRFISNRTLESRRFPFAEFVINEAPGLAWPLPVDLEDTFLLKGDMTVHGVTKPLTWEVSARFDGDQVSGQAKTNFKFDYFDMNVPSVFIVLSVEDNIRLEVDIQGTLSAR